MDDELVFDKEQLVYFDGEIWIPIDYLAECLDTTPDTITDKQRQFGFCFTPQSVQYNVAEGKNEQAKNQALYSIDAALVTAYLFGNDSKQKAFRKWVTHLRGFRRAVFCGVSVNPFATEALQLIEDVILFVSQQGLASVVTDGDEMGLEQLDREAIIGECLNDLAECRAAISASIIVSKLAELSPDTVH